MFSILFSLLSFIPIKTVHIIPLGPVKKETILYAKEAIKEFYGAEVILEQVAPLNNKYKRSGQYRYAADSILHYFNQRGTYRLILTEQDIAIFHNTKKTDWGVFGLGQLNGTTAVVSAFKNRLGRNAGKEVFKKRIRKVVIHELGHNLGLNHCTHDTFCVMSAAGGKATQVDLEREEFCSFCKLKLKF
jgi:archaemetzincin